ncbi:MAG: hypothetical protein GEV05_24655 [Betaproteobacteria bacterium]|nr:hypothetical protein [Betaproteobacteria bacterium]
MAPIERVRVLAGTSVHPLNGKTVRSHIARPRAGIAPRAFPLAAAYRGAWEAQEIHALQPDFATRTRLSTHPLRDAKTQSRLVNTLAELGF